MRYLIGIIICFFAASCSFPKSPKEILSGGNEADSEVNNGQSDESAEGNSSKDSGMDTVNPPDRDEFDFGLILHDDGDNSFQYPDPDDSVKKLHDDFDIVTSKTKIKTVSYCLGTGVLFYDTKAGSKAGWRKTENDTKYINNARIGLAKGVDPIRVVGERIKKQGLNFVLSHRINDSHFAMDPNKNPWTTEFWFNAPKAGGSVTIGKSPVARFPHYQHLFDFSKPLVRQYNLDIMSEATERYADIIDGFEIDFDRVPVFAAPGKAAIVKDRMTEMVAKLREVLDAVGKSKGKKLYLLVRVPPTLKHALWSGLDVETWISRRLVDVVIPSHYMVLAHNLDIREFVKLAKPQGIKVYPALYSRKNNGWPVSNAASPYSKKPSRSVWPELAQGAALNYFDMGADGIQLYNWRGYIRQESFQKMTQTLNDKNALPKLDKVFAVTPAYVVDQPSDKETFLPVKEIPVTLEKGKSDVFSFYVGHGYKDSDSASSSLVLRIGLKGATSRYVEVKLNDEVVRSDSDKGDLIAMSDASGSETPTHYIEINLPKTVIPKHGWNKLSIKGVNSSLTVVEIQLADFVEN